ncbi:MAG TPA: hypothetical protein VE058_12990 [Steroidobacteraceae bacterium]|nr:hypothetical protein [Steroidobacteraceae bacterium]
MEFDPLKYYKAVGRQRVRLPAAVAVSLAWSDSISDIPCIGVVTAPGELICAKMTAVSSTGTHPLAEAIARREFLRDGEDMSLGELAVATFVLSNRVFNFSARWTKDKAQIDLDLKSTTTLILGWNSDSKQEQPLIFPAVRDQILFLWSRARFEELLRLPIS